MFKQISSRGRNLLWIRRRKESR